MSEFDKWVRDNFYYPYDEPTPEQSFEAGQQSQQAKINEALQLLKLAYPENWGCCVEQTIDILKGNKDD